MSNNTASRSAGLSNVLGLVKKYSFVLVFLAIFVVYAIANGGLTLNARAMGVDILAPACGLPLSTPLGNIRAMVEAAINYVGPCYMRFEARSCMPEPAWAKHF